MRSAIVGMYGCYKIGSVSPLQGEGVTLTSLSSCLSTILSRHPLSINTSCNVQSSSVVSSSV